MTKALPTQKTFRGQPTTKKDNSALYEEIGDSVIQNAHSGDPIFERLFESAWKKVNKGAKR
jgi:hypothetical protein